MPKMSQTEIRRRLLANGAIKERAPMPERPKFMVDRTMSRLNAILFRRSTFKQGESETSRRATFKTA